MTDITMYAGNQHTFRVTVTDLETAAALDLTDADVKLKVSRKNKDTAFLFEKTLDDGVEIIDAVTGIFEATLAPADTFGLKGVYYYECDVIEPDGRISTVATGAITIVPTLLRDTDSVA